ncbi:unnamed protein product [Ixodes pacificus]
MSEARFLHTYMYADSFCTTNLTGVSCKGKTCLRQCPQNVFCMMCTISLPECERRGFFPMPCLQPAHARCFLSNFGFGKLALKARQPKDLLTVLIL